MKYFGERYRYIGFLFIVIIGWMLTVSVYGFISFYGLGKHIFEFPLCIVFFGLWIILILFPREVYRCKFLESICISDQFLILNTSKGQQMLNWQNIVSSQKSYMPSFNGFSCLDIFVKEDKKKCMTFAGLSDKDIYRVVGIINDKVIK